MTRKVMSLKENVRELRCKRSKKRHCHKFDKFDKQTCKSVFVKGLLCLYFMLQLYRRNGLFNASSIALNFSGYQWNFEIVELNLVATVCGSGLGWQLGG